MRGLRIRLPYGARCEASEVTRRSLRLSVDARRCTACGACVAACPESVITLERAADSALLAAGRQVLATVEVATCVSLRRAPARWPLICRASASSRPGRTLPSQRRWGSSAQTAGSPAAR